MRDTTADQAVPRRRVVVVIPVHNRRDITVAGVASLCDADRAGIDLTVIVIDDGSTDGTADAVHTACPDAVIVSGDGSLHYAGGTNLGLEHALRTTPEFVITANDDALFDHRVLVEMVACADRHPGSMIGALLTTTDRPEFAFQVGLHFSRRFGGWQVPQSWRVDELPTPDFEVETLVGNFLLIPGALVASVGLMDSIRFPIGAADVQWVRQMQRAGRRCVIASRARVRCRPNNTTTPLGELGVRDAARVLLLDRSHALNLRRHWRALWHSAPTRTDAAAAFVCHCAHLLARAVGATCWPRWPDPPHPTVAARPPVPRAS